MYYIEDLGDSERAIVAMRTCSKQEEVLRVWIPHELRSPPAYILVVDRERIRHGLRILGACQRGTRNLSLSVE